MQRKTIRAIAARVKRSFFAFIPKNLTGYPAAHALARYRCFLPDLAGLAGLRRAGPGVFNSNIFASAWVLTLMIQGEAGLRTEPVVPTCAAFALGGGVGARCFTANRSRHKGSALAVGSEAIPEIKSGRGPSRRAHRRRADNQPTSSFCKRFGVKRQHDGYVRSSAHGLRFAIALNSGTIR